MQTILLTGDTHGDFDRIDEFSSEYALTQDDVIIILGDAGINYWLNEVDERLKSEIENMDVTLFCIHGNHEERADEIETYEEEIWHGGIVFVEKEYPSILFAKDGEVYNFNGKKAIVIGGAYSVDKFYRLSNRMPWFDTEQPDEFIKKQVENKLDSLGWKIDYVFSHTTPLKYEPREVFLPNIEQETIDKSTEEWLDQIEDKLEYEHWYCGHYHTDKRIGQITFMYEEFEELEFNSIFE